jgi:hypothetical protein
VDFALSPNYFLFLVFPVSSGASREGFYPGGASARPANSPRSQNSLRQDSGSPPRLSFVELGLLPPKSPLWFFRPLALVLFSVRPLWVILQWSALTCCVPHRSSVFTLAFTSLGVSTRRRWSGLGFSHDFLSAGVFIPVQVFRVQLTSEFSSCSSCHCLIWFSAGLIFFCVPISS